MPRFRHVLLYTMLLLALAALMLYPLLLEIGRAFLDRSHLSILWFRSAFANDVFRRQLFTSLALAFTVTALANLIAFPLALIARHYDFRAKRLLSALLLAPMILPPFVGAIGMRQILGTFGSLTVALQHLGLLKTYEGIHWLRDGGFFALAILIALGLFPIAFLSLQAALANIDPAMIEAAQTLGGRRTRNFFKITLPLAMPGVFAGSALIFIWAFTELGTPLLLQYRNVVSRAVWDDLTSATTGNSSIGYAKVTIVLFISTAAFILGRLLLGRSQHAMTSKALTSAAPKRLTGPMACLAAVPFLAIIALALLPHIGVILYSFTALAGEPAFGPAAAADKFGWYRTILPDRFTFDGYRAVFQTPEILRAIVNALQFAAGATLIDIILGIAIAWILVRTRLPGRSLLDALAMLPLAVPGLVMAFGYLAVLLQFNWQNTLHNGPFWAVALILIVAYSIRRLPYMVRSASGGLQQTSVTFEEAAANLGASPARVLWKITIPLISANLIAGAILTFTYSLMEVSDSMILAQVQQFYPITKMIFTLGTDMSAPSNVRNACALGVVTMLFMAIMITAAYTLLGKRLGALFRA